MDRKTLLILALSGGLLYSVAATKPSPATTFAPVLMAPADKSLAKGFFSGMASAIEYDGGKSSPGFASDIDLINYRIRALDYTTQGGSFEAKYKGFGEYVGEILDDNVGREAKTLDAARRKAWVGAYRTIATKFEGPF